MYLCNGVEVRLYLSRQRRRDRLAPRLLRMRGTITYRGNGSAQCQCPHATSPLTPAVQYLLRYIMRLVALLKSIPTFGISSSLGDDVYKTNIYVITLFTRVIMYIINDMFNLDAKDGDYVPVINGTVRRNKKTSKSLRPQVSLYAVF